MRWKFDAEDANAACTIRREILERLHSDGAPDSDFYGAALVSGELLSNAVRHASGQVDVNLDWADHGARLRVRDGGPPFTPALEPAEAGDPLREHGRGLQIMRAMGAQVAVKADGEGKVICAALPVRRKRPMDSSRRD